MLYIILAILIFGVLIATHELGHFATAKLLGVKVNEFSIGMGPAVFKREKGETLYSVRLLPVGGYCAMEGEDDDSADPRSFGRASGWRKILILCAGAAMNFLTGIIILAVLLCQLSGIAMPVVTGFLDGYGLESCGLQEGDIVDVTFLKSQKHLTSMQLAQTAWQYEDVEHYEMNTVRNEVAIGEEVFQLSKDTQYFSQGHSIEKMDLNPADILTFHGIDSTVLSVTVEKGHGYLRLVNDENFVGGWLEIGQTQIVRITEDMLVTVPEGSYQVDISYNGGGGTKNVVINRNEETTLDIGDLEVAEAQYGMVLFSLSPSDTELYIDGSQVDASQPITLEYGIHQIIAKADGYKSLTQYLRVGQESAGVDVQLDKADSDSEDSTESSSSSSSSATESTSTADTTTTYYRVHIDAPENVEVYLDGNYVGISPCSFKKTSGSHVITLRKSGYETRSYTVQVDEEEKDVSYSFVDLTASSSSTE